MQREHCDARAAQPREDGFTLLELMMVIAIIGILMTALMPTFLAAGTRAKDRAMQSSLANATLGAKSFYLAKADYTLLSNPTLLAVETGNVTFVDQATQPSGVNSVSVLPVGTAQVVLAGQSKSGWCFYVLDDEALGATQYSKVAPAPGGCPGNTAPPPGDPSWKSTW
jgi:prepilin-type N-terminal cleavage/methylation domain-containing protein